MDNNRNSTPPNKDMTQRVPVQNDPRRTPKKKWYMTRKEKITLISLAIITVALIVGAVVAFAMNSSSVPDDGRILKGVYAAGVDLSGMTKGEARIALDKATADTYSKLDMVVSVLDTQINLSPANTGARLDIAAVVEDAYNYGRTGSRSEQEQAKENAQNNSVSIPITKHLNLNTTYIREEINKLGAKFSTTLTQPKLTLSGTKPSMNVANPDTSKTYQRLTIYVGTPEYGLDTNRLYNQVLEHYNIHMFKVEAACTVQSPDSFEEELTQYYNELCVEPVDAKMDPDTYVITPEIYGYGFDLNEVKELLAKTPYGSELVIELCYLEPNLTAELISSQTFKDVIGEDSSLLGLDEAWNTNVQIACQAINGVILKSGDVFSFKDALGELTAEKGYVEALAYLDRVIVSQMGGGISHVASVLYTSALEAELEIVERYNHPYVPTFVSAGRDAYVDDIKDFCFKNNRPDPIRICAEVVDGSLRVWIEGTDNRIYTVEITVKTKPIAPGTLYNFMVPSSGYADGTVLDAGMEGCEVEVYTALINKQTGEMQIETFLTTYSYEAKDAIIVKLQAATPH